MKSTPNLPVLAITLLCALLCSTSWAGAGGRVETIEGVRVVRLSGTSREIGIQHGTLLKAEIQGLVGYLIKTQKNLFGASLDDLAKGSKILAKHIPAPFVEEMQGVAEGAGVSNDDILYLNIFLDIISVVSPDKAAQCSNFVALPAVTGNGSVVHGRNLDWAADPAIVPANTVFVIKPTGGVPFICLSWPGIVGTLTGLNAEQVSMGEMTSVSTESTLEGMPIMLLLRTVLQHSKSLDDAYHTLSAGPRTTGYNVMVSSGKSESAFVAEMTSRRIARIEPAGGTLVSTNHFVLPALIQVQAPDHLAKDPGAAEADSLARYQRLADLLAAHQGNLQASTAETFLADKAVCRDTLQSAVMLPKTLEMLVAVKTIPAPDGGYVRIKLETGSGK